MTWIKNLLTEHLFIIKIMKHRILFLMAFCLSWTVSMVADDDVMITRDGSIMTVKIEKISNSQVTFVDLKHKKRGRLNAPANFVYMIIKEKGSNIFFDEEGNQTTSPVIKYDKKDNIMFLNRGEMFVVYNVSVGKNEVTYQLKDKKKEPFINVSKSDVFMIRNSDGTTTLYNDSYQEKQRKQQQAAAAVNNTTQTTTAATGFVNTDQQETTMPTANLAAKPQPAQATGAAVSSKELLASGTADTDFKPATGMSATDIEMAVNTKNPYTLYRKGSVAEYCFQYKGKQTQYMGGPTYFQQIVCDEKIENGLLVAHIKGALFNKKHEPSKGIAPSFKECIFPVEIDTAGTYHLTHNIAQDFFIISKRRGYGVLIPGDMHAGMQLKTSTLYDNAKNMIGGIVKVETAYSNWQVVGQEKITTPAGTFDCVKMTGQLAQKQGSNGKFIGEQITCWMARGIGIVQYETISDSDKKREPFIVYLNSINIK